MSRRLPALLLALAAAIPLAGQGRGGLTPKDLHALQSVGDVQVSPDGTRVAYTVIRNDGAGRPSGIAMLLNS